MAQVECRKWHSDFDSESSFEFYLYGLYGSNTGYFRGFVHLFPCLSTVISRVISVASYGYFRI